MDCRLKERSVSKRVLTPNTTNTLQKVNTQPIMSYSCNIQINYI